MKRRTVLKALALPAVAGALAGCNDTGSSDEAIAPPSPVPGPPSPGTFGYGALIRSEAELASTPTVLGKLSTQAASLPRNVDHRSTGFLPPVGNQGTQPSCVAWAVGYATTTYLAARKSSSQPTLRSQQASPADLYAKLQQIRPTQCREGTMITDALEILVRDKVSSLHSAPYFENACPAPRTDRAFSLTSYQRLDPRDTSGMKAELAGGKVLPFAMRVFSDFQGWGFGPNRDGVYHIAGTGLDAGHAMALVGYSDERSAWQVLNSYGSDFGTEGYFWLSFNSFASSVYEVWTADGAAVNPSPTPDPSPNPSPTQVAFASLVPSAQNNFIYGVAVLYLNFALTEPLFISSGSFAYRDTFGFGLPPYQGPEFPVGAWALQSYVHFWQSLPYQWPAGTYTLTLRGTTRDGRQVTVIGSTVYA
jgi:hypothetical protein